MAPAVPRRRQAFPRTDGQGEKCGRPPEGPAKRHLEEESTLQLRCGRGTAVRAREEGARAQRGISAVSYPPTAPSLRRTVEAVAALEAVTRFYATISSCGLLHGTRVAPPGTGRGQGGG